MDLIIPRDILDKFGSLQWEIAASTENDIVAELRRRGFVVERRNDLDFH
jgi:hypothetical protein